MDQGESWDCSLNSHSIFVNISLTFLSIFSLANYLVWLFSSVGYYVYTMPSCIIFVYCIYIVVGLWLCDYSKNRRLLFPCCNVPSRGVEFVANSLMSSMVIYLKRIAIQRVALLIQTFGIGDASLYIIFA